MTYILTLVVLFVIVISIGRKYGHSHNEQPEWVSFYKSSAIGRWEALIAVIIVWGYCLVFGKDFMGSMPFEKEIWPLWAFVFILFLSLAVIFGGSSYYYLKWLKQDPARQGSLGTKSFYYRYSIFRIGYSIIIFLLSLGIFFRLITLS